MSSKSKADVIALIVLHQKSLEAMPRIIMADSRNKIVSSIPDTTIEEFIRNFFKEDGYNQKYTSVYVDSGLQYCGTFRRRSLGDLYRLAINYFPETSLVDFTKSMVDVVESKPKSIGTSYCKDAGKRVYRNNIGFDNPRPDGTGQGTFSSFYSFYSELDRENEDEVQLNHDDYLTLIAPDCEINKEDYEQVEVIGENQ